MIERLSGRIDSFFDLFSSAQDKTARELIGRVVIGALIRSREDAECQDCGHKVSQHGPYGCEVEHDKVYGDCEFPRAVPCGCQAWTSKFDKE